MKVKIYGMSGQESKIFEILSREELESIIENIDFSEIYKRTFAEANGYSHTGTAYTYVDARNGEVKTYWTQNNVFQHPFDSFYEITLCHVDTPVEFETVDLIDPTSEEYEEFLQSDKTLEEFLGEEYQSRYWDVVDYFSTDFVPNWDRIKEQLDWLYSHEMEE